MENDLWSEKQLSRQNYLTDRPETWHKYSQLPARPPVKILTTTTMTAQKLTTPNSDGITEKIGRSSRNSITNACVENIQTHPRGGRYVTRLTDHYWGSRTTLFFL